MEFKRVVHLHIYSCSQAEDFASTDERLRRQELRADVWSACLMRKAGSSAANPAAADRSIAPFPGIIYRKIF